MNFNIEKLEVKKETIEFKGEDFEIRLPTEEECPIVARNSLIANACGCFICFKEMKNDNEDEWQNCGAEFWGTWGGNNPTIYFAPIIDIKDNSLLLEKGKVYIFGGIPFMALNEKKLSCMTFICCVDNYGYCECYSEYKEMIESNKEGFKKRILSGKFTELIGTEIENEN